MKIKVDRSKCTGCLLCEITCSLVHTGTIQHQASAIQVRLSDLGHDAHQPVLCRQCKNMNCLKSLNKKDDPRLRASFHWNDQAEAADDCPFGALFPLENKLVHCNLCDGDPECVKSCPTGALILLPDKKTLDNCPDTARQISI